MCDNEREMEKKEMKGNYIIKLMCNDFSSFAANALKWLIYCDDNHQQIVSMMLHRKSFVPTYRSMILADGVRSNAMFIIKCCCYLGNPSMAIISIAPTFATASMIHDGVSHLATCRTQSWYFSDSLSEFTR